MYNIIITDDFKSISIQRWKRFNYRILIYFQAILREKERERKVRVIWLCACVCVCVNSCESACVCACDIISFFLFFFFAHIVHRLPISFAIRVSGTFSFSYWTPSRCAKILIDKCATVPPASLFISVTVSYSGVISERRLQSQRNKCRITAIYSCEMTDNETIVEKNVSS